MTRRLITFLGKPSYDPKTGERRYKSAAYAFDGGQWVSASTGFFAVALRDWLAEAEGWRAQEIVVLGTHDSSWDALFELAGAEEDEAHLLDVMALEEVIAAGAMTEAHLSRVEEALRDALGGLSVRCVLISEAIEPGEQLDILRTLADGFCREDEVVLDVTHGFRHFGVLGAQSVLLLQEVLGVRLHGAFYGLFRGEGAEAVRLTALLRLSAWTEALAIFRRTGLLGALPELFRTAGHADAASRLELLAFSLMTQNMARARQEAEVAARALDALRHLSPVTPAALFAPQLARELRRVWRQDHLATSMLMLARQSLECGDSARAASLLFEALILSPLPESAWADRHTRERMRKAMWEKDNRQKRIFSTSAREHMTFLHLSFLRNTLVHGSDPNTEEHPNRFVQQAVQSPTNLSRALDTLAEQTGHLIAHLTTRGIPADVLATVMPDP